MYHFDNSNPVGVGLCQERKSQDKTSQCCDFLSWQNHSIVLSCPVMFLCLCLVLYCALCPVLSCLVLSGVVFCLVLRVPCFVLVCWGLVHFLPSRLFHLLSLFFFLPFYLFPFLPSFFFLPRFFFLSSYSCRVFSGGVGDSARVRSCVQGIKLEIRVRVCVSIYSCRVVFFFHHLYILDVPP